MRAATEQCVINVELHPLHVVEALESE